jgi:hypothetical protein
VSVKLPSDNWRQPDLDIGLGHLVWIGTDPYGEHDGEQLWVGHGFDKPAPCLGHITLGGTGWTLVSKEPLTVTPSLACGCGDHGFITNGKWVSA